MSVSALILALKSKHIDECIIFVYPNINGVLSQLALKFCLTVILLLTCF